MVAVGEAMAPAGRGGSGIAGGGEGREVTEADLRRLELEERSRFGLSRSCDLSTISSWRLVCGRDSRPGAVQSGPAMTLIASQELQLRH